METPQTTDYSAKPGATCNTTMHWGMGIGGLIVGIVVGVVLDPYLPAAVSPAKMMYQSGFGAAQAQFQASPLAKTVSDANKNGIHGTVTAINGDNITVHTTSIDPFADPALADRVVQITNETLILQLTAATSTKPVAKPSKTTAAPATSLPISAIKIGETVYVVSTSPVSNVKSFAANIVQIF